VRLELPGFFELQVNGFAGVDFNDPALADLAIARATAAQRRTGVTRYLPTLITSSLDDFRACAAVLARSADPAIAGIHMEGPYLAAAAKGAHPEAHLALPALDDWHRRQDAALGRIRLVTLAPELPGALALIERLVAEGVLVSLGHTAATPAQIRDGVRAGARLSTHLGNGCPPNLPRHPNLLWEQLAADELSASFIVDGHHLPPATVKAMIRAKTPSRSVLVTDAIVAAGCPPGRYHLGGQEIELSPAGRVTLLGTERLAGAAIAMHEAVANTARFCGLPIEEAWSLASANPAALVGEAPVGVVVADWDAGAGRLTISNVTG
jgi:N-acetylglucosamine-6-phosphate deacetylase